MALSVTEANAISLKHFDKVITQQVYEDSPFFTKLKKMGNVVPGGTKITWPVRYDEYGEADAVGPRQQLVYSTKETRTEASLDWKYYASQSMITWDERVKNADGKTQIIDLLKDKAKEIKEDFYDRMIDDVYTANPNGNGFSSLGEIVDSSGTYAGISPSDASSWASIEDSSTTTLSLYGGTTSLAGMIDQATFGKKLPSMHFTTRALRTKFESLIEPQKRYQDEEMASAGFPNVAFHGAAVFGDTHCPANTWYGLCMKEFYLVYQKDNDFSVSPWKELDQVGYPKSLMKWMTWVGNIKCVLRRPHFKFTALDPANG